MKTQTMSTRRRQNTKMVEAGSASIEQPANSPVSDGAAGPVAEMIGAGAAAASATSIPTPTPTPTAPGASTAPNNASEPAAPSVPTSKSKARRGGGFSKENARSAVSPAIPPATASKVGPASKTELVLKRLRAHRGATVDAIMKDTGWQAHSVRGFLSGTVRKKLGLALTSQVGKDGVRRYSVPGQG